MIAILSLSVSCVLLGLSVLHVYWMLGGRWGIEAVIPVRGNKRLFTPGKIGTLGVAAMLAFAAAIIMGIGGLTEPLLPGWVYQWGGWVIFGVFLLRAIGEFRWVGFFKTEKGTLFARWDTRVFSPLCFLLAAAVLTVLII
ncbi:DUF3995 domain-containing protein [Paenibacillus sp. ACRRX]|uniref:DUF3995 domain-containing protein n=1 Tax=Paenibacillus sp. ACRRX TaxID=2918206 RepID=UPI001EF736BF|nr:DUF3995 domain-containing protein [Paenibacillus sp. ACRRX]MCG7408740.1 DUF3995 domain-containing protein [Paenibacillus sp. ACRRX]